MTAERAERFVVLNLRLLAASFAVVGILFIAVPDGVLDVISDLGDAIGSFTTAPETVERLWLALAFAYMVVITGICLVVQSDPVRYRPLLLVLAAGKAASSLAALAFFVFDQDVFIYLLNFLVDGFLVGASLLLWSLTGRIGDPAAPLRRGSPGLGAGELEVLRAFGEAMAPGVDGLPPVAGPATGTPVDGAVEIAAPLNRYLATLQPRSVRQLRLALRVLDRLSFPRRFSRSSIVRRQRLLSRLDGSRLPFASDLLLFLKVLAGLGYGNDPRVRAAVGYEMRCAVDGGGPGADGIRPPELGDLRPPGEDEDCDVAIVGSGAGGAVTAAILAEAGLDVLVLEAGAYMDRRTYPEEPLAALSALYRDGGLTIAEGRPAIPTPVGRAVGGTTVINSGTCFRAPEEVLAGWRAGHGIEWATELAEDYVQAEEMLRVRPVDPERMGRNGQVLREGAEALGLSHHPLKRNAGRCLQCSSCPSGCRLDAKQAMHVSYLPRAAAAGARIRAGLEARRITFEAARATGLECVATNDDGAGRVTRVRARRAVIVAGGAFGTPELLLRSGYRSPSGAVGRHLRIHPACWVGARFENPVRGWEGVMQSYAVDEWEERGLLLEATFTPLAFGAQWLPGTGAAHQERVRSYDRIASTGVHLSDRSSGRVGLAGDGSLRITYRLSDEDARRLVFGIARAAEIFYAAGATEVYPQIAGLPTISSKHIAALEASPPRSAALRLEAFHPMGTARMDADPTIGVVGADGAAHGAEALYVADASLLPSSIGVNPMMTVIAMASRVARQLADRLN